MFDYIKLIMGVFHQGQAIVSAAKVKNWTLVGNASAVLLGVLVAIAKVSGHDIPLSNDDLVTLGAAVTVVLGVFNPVSAIITSDKIGLPAKSDAATVQVIEPATSNSTTGMVEKSMDAGLQQIAKAPQPRSSTSAGVTNIDYGG